MSSERSTERLEVLRARYNAYILDGIPRLRRLGYNPFQFLEMVERYTDPVGATKHLLAQPGHTSYGFRRLLELGRLEDSVEFATCLPWFADLFEPQERDEARVRLLLHDFPLHDRIRIASDTAPAWTREL
jgi:hypothetical protein